MPRERLLFDIEDAKEMLGKALLGGFLGVLSIVFVSYIIYCVEDTELIARTGIFEPYGHGNVYNEVMGLWAVAFTPPSTIGYLVPNWLDDFAIYLAPAMFAGFVIALKTKSIKWAPVGGLFFIMWGFILPLTFMWVLPMFGIVDPTAVNAGLMAAFPDVYRNFSPFYQMIGSLYNSVFLTWCTAGAIEYGIIATLFALPLSLLFSLLQKLFTKE